MSQSPATLPLAVSNQKPINPWLMIPVLYFMQALPVATVQEVFVFPFKDLGIPNPTIAAWLSIAAIPWTLKLFWGPLVDLNMTKRKWVVLMQVLIVVAFALLGLAISLPQWDISAAGAGHALPGFWLAVSLLILTAVLSATHDIAADGFYILSLDPARRAKFVGVQGTAYKLGRLFCVAVLVTIAGKIPRLTGLSISGSWAIVLGIITLVYAAGAFYNAFLLPRPADDKPAVESSPAERKADLFRILTVVAVGVCLFFILSAGIRLSGHYLQQWINQWRAQSTPPAAPMLLAWKQDAVDLQGWNGWPAICLYSMVAFVPLWILAARMIGGTPIAESFGSFARQRGFWAIFLFVMFYRFGEAMVTRTLPLFLKDPLAKGGLAITTEAAGQIVGYAGVIGIIIGGILGGLVVSRWGLRKSFWPLAIAMHAPNLLYLWIAASYQRFDTAGHWQNFLITDWPLYAAAFVHEFGYGFGFAAYFVFLMDVAQRGNFKTSHYAIGTGLGALCGTLAGIVSAILIASLSWVGFFVAVCILSVPGLLTLLVIPLNEPAPAKA